MSFEQLLVVAAVLLLSSIVISKRLEKTGIPPLILFLLIGMLAGSEGPGKIHFDHAYIAQSIGVVALIYILFSGGLDTRWKSVRPVMWSALSLSTIGVLLTAIAVGLFAMVFLNFSLQQGLLLGSIISSTDAAAVFLVLRSKSIDIHGKLKSLVELESGSNDPMAIFLTMSAIQVIKNDELSAFHLVSSFTLQMTLGVVFGIVFGVILLKIINLIKLESEELYSIFTFSSVLLVYGLTALLEGSGFLAVYTFGLVLGNNNFLHKNIIRKFHDGIAGLMQIIMFLVLGLLVFPSRLIPVILPGLFISAFLIFVARTVGVFVSLVKSKFTGIEKLMLSWMGLKGAVPIILAIFSLLAGVDGAEVIFNIVFFVVLTSTLIQGATIPQVARFLGIVSHGKRIKK